MVTVKITVNCIQAYCTRIGFTLFLHSATESFCFLFTSPLYVSCTTIPAVWNIVYIRNVVCYTDLPTKLNRSATKFDFILKSSGASLTRNNEHT